MSSYSITLRSENPAMVLEFELPPGSHARIGAAADAEISLPLAGLADHACLIGRLADGRIYLADSAGGNQRFVRLPAAMPMVPYQFVAFHPAAVQAAPAPPREESSPRPASGIPRVTLGIIAASVVIGLGGAAFLVHSLKPGPSTQRLVSAERRAAYEAEFFAAGSVPVPEPTELEPHPSAPSIELFLEHSSLARVLVVTYDKNDKDLSATTGAIISPDGLVATSMDPSKVGVKATIFTGEGKWHHITRPATVDRVANLVLFKADANSLPHFELGESGSMDTDSPALIMHAGGQTVESIRKCRLAGRETGSSADLSGLPNSGNLLSFPTTLSPCGVGSPVLDRNLKLVALTAFIPLGMGDPSADQCIPVEALRSLLKKYHETPPAPEPLSPEEAADEADNAFRADPDTKAAYDLSGKRQWKKSIILARKLVEKHPGSPEAYLQLGNVHIGNGDGAGAEPILRQGFAISPEDPRFMLLLGMALDKQQKIDGARAFWTMAADFESTRSSAWDMLALSYLRLGENRKAIPALENVRKFNRQSFEEIMKDFEKVPQTDPGVRELLRHFERLEQEDR